MLALATALTLALAGAPDAPAAQPERAAKGSPRLTLALLPRATTIDELAEAAPDASLGFLSAGLGRVAPEQTYLDIGQGNRLFDSLYPRELGPAAVHGGGVPAPHWRRIVERAERAPASLTPGLLAEQLRREGVEVSARPEAGRGMLLAADSAGRTGPARSCPRESCEGLGVTALELDELGDAIAGLGEGDLLIALAAPSPWRTLLPIAIAGEGFTGSLRSPTTRIDGYVLSTDIAPTVLEHFSAAVPGEVSGRSIEGGGGRDAAELTRLKERLEQISPRRTPVIADNLAIWLLLALAACLLGSGRIRAPVLATLAVTIALAPSLLVAVTGFHPSELAERLVVGVGTPLGAAALLAALRRLLGPARGAFAAFAAAATLSLIVVAADVLAGSALTSLSVIGPNPGLGVRFYGIGNELEATIAVLLALAAGAAVSAARPADPARAVTAAAVAATVLAVAIFAPGRFGAAVGAAITFPAAAAGVAVAALGASRLRLLALLAAPLLAVGALVAIDVVAGGDAHLSRSVLEAGGLDELGQVVERRTRLAAASFGRFVESPFYVLALLLIVVGIVLRRRILALLDPWPAARAGLVGALTAAVVGTVANDSGALLLVVGTAYVAAFIALSWAAGRSAPSRSPPG